MIIIQWANNFADCDDNQNNAAADDDYDDDVISELAQYSTQLSYFHTTEMVELE